MSYLLNFLIVIGAGLFFSGLFRKLHLPYVTTLILSGIIVGPFGLNWISPDPTLDGIAAIGVMFLMFMAGLEVQIKSRKDITSEAFALAFLNGSIPFLTGLAIGLAFGYTLTSSLVIGVVFISSSIAVIVPQLEKTGLIHRKIGKNILSATIFLDILSLLLLSMVLQSILPKSALPAWMYFPILVLSVVGMRITFPRIKELYQKTVDKKDAYESELRFLFVVLFGSAIFFEALGLHAIVAGFVIGLVLSETIKHKSTTLKIRTIAYGLFIPTFFVLIGSSLDLGAIHSGGSILLIVVMVSGQVLSKMLSGYFAGRMAKNSHDESMFMAFATTPQLSTTLAAAFAAAEFGLLDGPIIAGFISLTIVTTFTAPMGMKFFSERILAKDNLPVQGQV